MQKRFPASVCTSFRPTSRGSPAGPRRISDLPSTGVSVLAFPVAPPIPFAQQGPNLPSVFPTSLILVHTAQCTRHSKEMGLGARLRRPGWGREGWGQGGDSADQCSPSTHEALGSVASMAKNRKKKVKKEKEFMGQTWVQRERAAQPREQQGRSMDAWEVCRIGKVEGRTECEGVAPSAQVSASLAHLCAAGTHLCTT